MVLQQVITAGGAFMVTNVDDIVVLTLLFSKVTSAVRALPLIAGQILGFGALVLISLFGVVGAQALPHSLLPLFGLIPIGLGLRCWVQSSDEQDVAHTEAGVGDQHATLISPHPMTELVAMAGLTIVNGSDNVGVYLPLFAQADRSTIFVFLLTFAISLTTSFALSWGLTRAPAIAPLLHRYGSSLLPVVLIGLGLSILFSPT